MTAPDTPTQDDVLVLLPRLRRFAWVLTADLRRADELVLETLGRAGRQSPPAPWPQLRHWLFAVMHRLHRDWLIREPRRQWKLFPADRPVMEARDFPPPTGRNHGDDVADELLARFSRLPAEQREILALVVLEGLFYTEIADVLDVPVGTVMSRLHAAREAMGSGVARPAGK